MILSSRNINSQELGWGIWGPKASNEGSLKPPFEGLQRVSKGFEGFEGLRRASKSFEGLRRLRRASKSFEGLRKSLKGFEGLWRAVATHGNHFGEQCDILPLTSRELHATSKVNVNRLHAYFIEWQYQVNLIPVRPDSIRSSHRHSTKYCKQYPSEQVHKRPGAPKGVRRTRRGARAVVGRSGRNWKLATTKIARIGFHRIASTSKWILKLSTHFFNASHDTHKTLPPPRHARAPSQRTRRTTSVAKATRCHSESGCQWVVSITEFKWPDNKKGRIRRVHSWVLKYD